MLTLDDLNCATIDEVDFRELEEVLHYGGKEYPNPTPLVVNVKVGAAPSLQERIMRVLNGERLRKMVEAQGFETEEEANDFDIPDEDPGPISPYEVVDMVPEAPEGTVQVPEEPLNVQEEGKAETEKEGPEKAE